MPLLLNEEQEMLRDVAERFVAERSPLAAHRSLRDRGEPLRFDAAVWAGMAEMGWAGLLTPEQYDGLDFGFVGAGVVAQAMGRHLCATPFLASAVMAATALVRGGSTPQKETMLPAMARGELIVTLAVDEGPHHSPAGFATTANRDGEGYRLTGRKCAVLEVAAAQSLLVAAQLPADGHGVVGLFLVPCDSAGVQTIPACLVDHRGIGSVVLEDVDLPASARLEAADGEEVLRHALDAGRACLAAEMLGAAEEAFARTLEYLKTREQFGRPIGSFQGLQHRAAQMHGELELCRSAVLAALQALDANDEESAELVSIAKAKTSKVFMRVSAEAIQMHGGIGMTDECEIGFFYKRAAVARQLLGDENFHADRYARLKGY